MYEYFFVFVHQHSIVFILQRFVSVKPAFDHIFDINIESNHSNEKIPFIMLWKEIASRFSYTEFFFLLGS